MDSIYVNKNLYGFVNSPLYEETYSFAAKPSDSGKAYFRRDNSTLGVSLCGNHHHDALSLQQD